VELLSGGTTIGPWHGNNVNLDVLEASATVMLATYCNIPTCQNSASFLNPEMPTGSCVGVEAGEETRGG